MEKSVIVINSKITLKTVSATATASATASVTLPSGWSYAIAVIRYSNDQQTTAVIPNGYGGAVRFMFQPQSSGYIWVNGNKLTLDGFVANGTDVKNNTSTSLTVYYR